MIVYCCYNSIGSLACKFKQPYYLEHDAPGILDLTLRGSAGGLFGHINSYLHDPPHNKR